MKIDDLENGPIPELWDYSILPSEPFTDEDIIVRQPHTDQRSTCKNCLGKTKVTCNVCHGRGWVRSSYTDSNGHRQYRNRDNINWVVQQLKHAQNVVVVVK